MAGDLITCENEYKDTTQQLTGVVARILAEGKQRTLYSGEGVLMARYVIGRPCATVELIRAVSEPSEPLEMFA